MADAARAMPSPPDRPAGSAPPRTLGAARRWLRDYLAEAGVPDPDTDARRLIVDLAGVAAAELIGNSERRIDADAWKALAEAARRRAAREPVSRILGRRAFHGLDLEIDPATLDPRPDTETVVDVALAVLADRPGGIAAAPIRLLDIGTGSGAIALALLATLPGATAVATDISPEALAVARRNADRLGLAERLMLVETSWADGIGGRFDLIVTNPPYIPTAAIAWLEPEVRSFDPVLALDGGADGLGAYRAIAPLLRRLLAAWGVVVAEVGHDQASSVAGLFRDQGLAIITRSDRIDRDLGGHRRCVMATIEQCPELPAHAGSAPIGPA